MDIYVKTAFGTAVVNYDLLKDEPKRTDPMARVVKGYALVGGGAAADCAIELFVGGQRVGTQWNSSTGDSIDMNKDVVPCDIFVRPGAQIEAKVIDAAPSGNMTLGVIFGKPTKTFTPRRAYTAKRTSPTSTRRGNSATRRY